MNKSELIREVARKANLSVEQSASALEAVLGTVVDTVNKGDSVTLLGFGTFSVISRKARNGRNPSTGVGMLIPAKKAVRFKPGSKMNPE